ncbi:hypothetical protein KU6B_26980 [Mameliella alba]|uniref:PD-(D/E)XK nuclease family protein n=1 Tax=Mameliella alba TaxID=561184 RepID=UPI0013E4BAF7|nr:PD-(D/E)XK nuclease family protein [Mameliella alba]BBU56433.1 hypothetical protein KU6B_26980 [Mameliella alba]
MIEDEYIPTLSHATERDIDLLLVEELYASVSFLIWIASRAGLPSDATEWDVKHSKRRTRSRREIDIFVDIGGPGGRRNALLIENKLDATEQPDQAESYREELEFLAEGFASASMIIVCPETYAVRHSEFTEKFDAVVSYEDIRDYFLRVAQKSDRELARRYDYRAEILDQAINKYRRGYAPVPDKVVGDFNARYVELLSVVAPDIRPGSSMKKPANPRESTSMIFDPNATLADLPKEIRPRRFAHELGRGSDRRANYVAVTFAGWGAALPGIRTRLEADTVELGADFSAKSPTMVRPNPGLVLSIPTGPVDNQGNFDTQIDALEDGMAVASELRRWLLGNSETLFEWKRLVETEEQLMGQHVE